MWNRIGNTTGKTVTNCLIVVFTHTTKLTEERKIIKLFPLMGAFPPQFQWRRSRIYLFNTILINLVICSKSCVVRNDLISNMLVMDSLIESTKQSNCCRNQLLCTLAVVVKYVFLYFFFFLIHILLCSCEINVVQCSMLIRTCIKYFIMLDDGSRVEMGPEVVSSSTNGMCRHWKWRLLLRIMCVDC